MAEDHFTCAEVARLVRSALKESFPSTKFSIRSKTYSMGASISVTWEDGPSEWQVAAISRVFHGAKYDSDAKLIYTHTLDNVPVRFSMDRVHLIRTFSDRLVAEAIDEVYHERKAAFDEHKLGKPTVAQYRNGDLWSPFLVDSDKKNVSVAESIIKTLTDLSKVPVVQESETLGRVNRLEDSEKEGSGHA